MTEYIGLSGYARVGKDTAAQILGMQWGWKRHAFADKLKEAVYVLNPFIFGDLSVQQAVDDLGVEEVKNSYPEYRRLLQVFGTEVGRNLFGDNFWVDLAMKSVQDNEKAVFTDCRFPNEAEAITEAGGQVWRIKRPGFGPVNGHASETSLDDWPFDEIIKNNGNLANLKYELDKALHAPSKGWHHAKAHV